MPLWLFLNLAAMIASLGHVLIDYHLGLLGDTSSTMSALQASGIALLCLVVAWWTLCLAMTTPTGRPALPGALVMAIVWAFLGNGVGGLVAAPPPSDAAPYQDVTHLAAAAFGAAAAVTTWRAWRATGPRQGRLAVAVSFLLLLGLFLVQAWLSAP